MYENIFELVFIITQNHTTGNGSSILWHSEVTSRNSGSQLSSGYANIIRWVMVGPGLSNVTADKRGTPELDLNYLWRDWKPCSLEFAPSQGADFWIYFYANHCDFYTVGSVTATTVNLKSALLSLSAASSSLHDLKFMETRTVIQKVCHLYLE